MPTETILQFDLFTEIKMFTIFTLLIPIGSRKAMDQNFQKREWQMEISSFTRIMVKKWQNPWLEWRSKYR